MNNISIKSFGVVIAFLIPGFIAVLGISLYSPLVRSWLNTTEQMAIGGILYSSIFSLGCGIVLSTVRWLVIDSIHHQTGITKQKWDYRKLQANIAAYQLLEENHYRFYQFYGNTLCALIFSYLSWRLIEQNGWPCWPDAGFLTVSFVLFAGSRDTLRKYYVRVNELLATP